ncbi:MAG: hypothetical protein RML46_11500 [Anaerolineae bacterium]|nr:hypothetical protein [Anaerolineae bacterium]
MQRARLSVMFASLVVGLSLIAGLGIGGVLKPSAPTVQPEGAAGYPTNPTIEALKANAFGKPQPTRQALTLKEAYQMLLMYAELLPEKAVVVGLQSVDLLGDTSYAGQDGCRRGWLGRLRTSEQEFTIRLEDGSVAESVQQPLSETSVALPEPAVDSPQALHQVELAYPNFGPSRDPKGKGLHFFLDSTSGVVTLGILGAMGNQRCRILVDAQTGRVISSQIYTWAQEGGILYSVDGGQTWAASNLRGQMVKAIAVDPVDTGVAYAVAPGARGIVLYRTQDGGQRWEEWGRLPLDAGDWPFDALVLRSDDGRQTLLVGAWTGIWQSQDGQSWALIKDGPPGPIQWLAGLRSEDGEQLFASVTAGENRGIYASRGDGQWTQIAHGIYRLATSVDGRSLMAFNEESPGQALVIRAGQWQSMDIPAPVLDAAGDFQRAEEWFIRSPMGGVGLYHKSRGNVRWTLPGPIASIAVSPAFLTDRLALAGGFRSGIFRTTDGGHHWEQALARPSTVILGSDEIYEIVFLSPTSVLAIQGGRMTWQ